MTLIPLLQIETEDDYFRVLREKREKAKIKEKLKKEIKEVLRRKK